ncbi:hypothetical protein AGABI2DRAFT_141219 [Agaricus bisporus var. bisporus H97]|uniref:hypothetical protein n=1 Tax=Agaricus bisporus var. bisporus (strain H97 / ATCC MYA-4626 / FGSC 10389) TaxID=936046 RepID=UPI00029F7D45|nr:hypothetical protein AGABI2DRAFT_141219 [Agaricus bisporus var. bisporus H97]EKV50312.1 hypothetical protein AGABI2DRAFT_141219 [Agaricus bisporus var. bisporus H97]
MTQIVQNLETLGQFFEPLLSLRDCYIRNTLTPPPSILGINPGIAVALPQSLYDQRNVGCYFHRKTYPLQDLLSVAPSESLKVLRLFTLMSHTRSVSRFTGISPETIPLPPSRKPKRPKGQLSATSTTPDPGSISSMTTQPSGSRGNNVPGGFAGDDSSRFEEIAEEPELEYGDGGGDGGNDGDGGDDGDDGGDPGGDGEEGDDESVATDNTQTRLRDALRGLNPQDRDKGKGKGSNSNSNNQQSSSGNNNSKPGKTPNSNSNSNSKSNSNLNAQSSSSSSNPLANVLGKNGKLTPEERQRRKDKNLCMFCGGTGHTADNCSKKTAGKSDSASNKPKRRSANADTSGATTSTSGN